MPKYKKAKRSRFNFFKNKNFINMKSFAKKDKRCDNSKNQSLEYASSFRVILGKKEKIKRRNIIIACCVFALIISFIILNMLTPTGIKESLNNYFAAVSLKDHFPNSFEGNNLYSVNIKNRYFYTLTNSSFSCFAKNGKTLFTNEHGFENPVAVTSETRALIYDQNGNNIKVFTADRMLFEKKTEFSIYTADIARNGTFAVATKAQSYASTVTVYDKNGKFVYEWSTPTDIITSVAVSPDGEKLAVAGVYVNNGKFVSKISVFEYNSADPVWSFICDNEFITAFESINRKYFCAVSENQCRLINWKDFKTVSYSTENSIKYIKSSRKFTVVCDANNSDNTNNTFTFYNKKSQKEHQFLFEGPVDDFCLLKKHVLILGGNSVSLVDFNGKVIKTADCSYSTVGVAPINKERFIAISDNELKEINFK